MAVSPRRLQPDTVRVAALDVQHSHRRSAVVAGPVAIPPLEQLRARFAAMAAVGPITRIGLLPSTSSTRWRYAPELVGRAITEASSAAGTDPVALLPELHRLPGEGIRILAGGEYLVIDFSHGLGEIRLLDLLIAVLLGAVDPADDDRWTTYRHSVPPLLTAAVRAIGMGPQRLLPLWRQHRRNVAAAPGPTALHGVGVQPSPATRIARISADGVAELRGHRDSALPGVSLFAIYTCALHEAFRDAGFDIDPTVTLPFDVRRYLPDGCDTLASFSAGLDFPLDRAGPRGLHERMLEATRMARPVANLIVGSLKARAAMGAHERTEWAVGQPPRMRLLHSSIGTVPKTGWSFSDAAQARILVASDPVGPCGMTVTTSTVEGTLWMTAHFHDSVFDADRVSAALDSVPVRVHSLLTTSHRR